MIELKEKRYLPTFCIKTDDNKFYPFWELEYVNDEDYGEGFNHKESYKHHSDLIECYWDTKDKKLVFGITKDVFPKKTRHSIGDHVFAEASYDTFYEAEIVDIKFEKFDVYIKKFKKLEQYERNDFFTTEELKSCGDTDIYEFRIFQPTYVLDDGKEIVWEHQLKNKRK